MTAAPMSPAQAATIAATGPVTRTSAAVAVPQANAAGITVIAFPTIAISSDAPQVKFVKTHNVYKTHAPVNPVQQVSSVATVNV